MGEARPPRRAVFRADLRNGYRYFGRSPGWPGEAAALDALRLLDSEVASLESEQLSGFFCIEPDGWVIVRGGLVAAGEAVRYWREAIALDPHHLAQLRYNPFRILSAAPVVAGDARRTLAVPLLPPPLTAQDELARIEELKATLEPAVLGQLEELLAAVLDAEHTLLTGSNLTQQALELLVLMLPPRLRPRLTFHAHALSLPPAPLPRLVLTPLGDGEAFDTPPDVWGHRLPRTARDLSAEARSLASQLFALVAAPERLSQTHSAYERYASPDVPPGPDPLIRDVAAAVRLGRVLAMRDTEKPSAGLRTLEESITAHKNTHHPEPVWLAGLLQDTFAPAALGAAVAGELRGSGNSAGAALLLESFAARRQTQPAEFAAFTRRVEQDMGGGAFSGDEESTRRARTMLMLFAAVRGDVGAMLSAMPVPVDDLVVSRLGGAEAWAPENGGALAEALRAFCAAHDAGGALAAIRSLDALRTALPRGAEQLRLVDVAVSLARWQLSRAGPADWRETLPLAAAAFELAVAVTSEARISLSGRPDHEHIRDLLGRSMNAAATLDAAGHSDAELFLGFLGLDASRSRLARREIGEAAEILAGEILGRTRDAQDGQTREAAHWALALLQRVAVGQLEPAHVEVAALVLRRALPAPEAGAVIRDLIAAHPALAPAVIAFGSPRETLEPLERTAIAAVALAESAADAAARSDTGPVITLCQQLQQLDVRLGAGKIGATVESRLRKLGDELRAKSGRPFATHLAALSRAFAPVMDEAALALARSALEAGEGAAPGGASAHSQWAMLNRLAMPKLRRGMRRGLPLAGAAVLGMLAVLFSSETGRRAIFGFGSAALAAFTPLADPAARLEQARTQATANDWANVVELLSGHTLDRNAPEALAWDSLLAYAALLRGQRMQPEDVRRPRILGLARDRASRAVELATERGTSGELLRLIRAEACVSAAIGCDPAVVVEDLELAAKSGSRVVAERARRILELLE